MRRLRTFAALLLLAAVTTAFAEAAVLKSSTKGTPALKTINVLAFAPQGVLLIGDGQGAQIIAVQTGDQPVRPSSYAKIEGINARLAERLGTTADGIELLDMAVNPESGKAYIAVRKQDDKTYVILTVDGEGTIGQFVLEDVTFARIALPPGEHSPVNRISDVAWAEEKVIAAAAASEEFASKIFVAEGPIVHNSQGTIHSAETYHVSHRKWETRAPMSAIIPYQEDGQTYVIGAFACTPVVKYPLSALKPGAHVKGVSVIELGSGNRPLDMFSYQREGKEYVLANTFRFHHERRPFGPSPYWTVRIERSLLDEDEKVNEKAVNRLSGDKPATDRIVKIDAYDGVMQMDQLDETRALVLRGGAEGRVDLEAIPLP